MKNSFTFLVLFMHSILGEKLLFTTIDGAQPLLTTKTRKTVQWHEFSLIYSILVIESAVNHSYKQPTITIIQKITFEVNFLFFFTKKKDW